MNIFKKFILLNFILLLVSCGAAKDAFTNQKKSSTDEFLVEKKSPLTMHPSYGELPAPSNEKLNKESQTNNIKSLITEENDNKKLEIIESDNDFEQSILDKIKNN